MNKRLGICLAVIVLLSILVSGCAKKEQGLLDPNNPISISVWTYYNGDQLAAFSALVDEFNETEGKDQGIYVESFSQGTVNDLETTVLAAAAGKVGAGKIPNIFAAYADTAYAVDQMGMVADLSEYLTEEEVDAYVDSYMDEGRFSEGGIKIFPLAKSTEVFLLNRTDWQHFAEATGASYDDLATVEGLTAVAQSYYEWTDSLTLEPNDGKAFFGRDAMANYFLIGAMEMGVELFSVENSHMTLHFDKEVIRRLWDNYYVPFVKGYFAASGRFRSDDIKTGNIVSFVGSSSGATFFPSQVIVSDTESYPIEMEVLPCPIFQGGQEYAVQQGAGMVVTKGTEAEIYASVQFLKWFTQDERNIRFSVESGYLPVTKHANQIDTILASGVDVDQVMERILTVAVDAVNERTLYTPKAFSNGTDARNILEYSMSDLAAKDRETVCARLAEGMSLEEASAEFVSDEAFEAWYQETLASLEALAG